VRESLHFLIAEVFQELRRERAKRLVAAVGEGTAERGHVVVSGSGEQATAMRARELLQQRRIERHTSVDDEPAAAGPSLLGSEGLRWRHPARSFSVRKPICG
jgi:hypothetical protein